MPDVIATPLIIDTSEPSGGGTVTPPTGVLASITGISATGRVGNPILVTTIYHVSRTLTLRGVESTVKAGKLKVKHHN